MKFRSKGFTLLELLVAMAVLAVIATVGIPSMTAAVERRQTVDAVERIFSEIRLARSASVARSENVFMNISPGANWAIGVSNDATCDPTDNNPACTLPDLTNANPITHLYTVANNDNVSLTTTNNQISFAPQRGTATGTTVTVTSTGDIGYIVNVIVRPLGQIAICSPDTNPSRYLSTYRVC